MEGVREVRVRPEYIPLYPALPPGWQPAGSVAERVAEYLIARRGYSALRQRVLPPQHFEFRGAWPHPVEPQGRLRRLADRMS